MLRGGKIIFGKLQYFQFSYSEATTLSKGIIAKLNISETVIALHVAQAVFNVMHPGTITPCALRLQGIVLDYGGVQSIIKSSKTKIGKLRKD